MANHAQTLKPFTVAAPGRVNLIGEHTDYNDGLVLPLAIGRGLRITVTPRADRLAVWTTSREPGQVVLDLALPLRPLPGSWATYPAGVLGGFQKLGWDVPGFEARVTADLPSGGGLSSSAALEVATATVVETLCGESLPLEQKALLCQRAEHDFAGVPCGIMDQFAVTFGRSGHALLLDCRTRAIRFVPLSEEVAVLVVNSGVRHRLADGEYALRRKQCATAATLLSVSSLREVSQERFKNQKHLLPSTEFRRVRHVVTEHERTLAFVAALEKSDWRAAGSLMRASHDSLRHDYEVSCPELDTLVELSGDIPGVHGCRMTGGGFGGCVVALVETAKAGEAMRLIRQRYRVESGLEADAFVTKAVDGAKVISESNP